MCVVCSHSKSKLNLLTGEDQKRKAASYLKDLLETRSNEKSSNIDTSPDNDDFFVFYQQTIHEKLQSKSSNVSMYFLII